MRRYLWAAVAPAIACAGTLYRVSQSHTGRAVRPLDAAQFFFAGLCLGFAIWGAIVVSRSPAPKP